jgi:hypothetical protein
MEDDGFNEVKVLVFCDGEVHAGRYTVNPSGRQRWRSDYWLNAPPDAVTHWALWPKGPAEQQDASDD